MADQQQLATGKTRRSTFWIVRALSIVVVGGFSLLLFSAFAGEDKPEGAEILVYIPLVVAIVGCLLAWRWQKAGGVIAVIGGALVSAMVFLVSMEFGGYLLAALYALFYGAPFLVVGVLFVRSGKAVQPDE